MEKILNVVMIAKETVARRDPVSVVSLAIKNKGVYAMFVQCVRVFCVCCVVARCLKTFHTKFSFKGCVMLPNTFMSKIVLELSLYNLIRIFLLIIVVTLLLLKIYTFGTISI